MNMMGGGRKAGANSRLLDFVWVTAAMIICLFVAVARFGPHEQRHWANLIVAATAFIGLVLTLIFNRVARGRWFPGPNGDGTAVTRRIRISMLVLLVGSFAFLLFALFRH